MQIIIVGCGKVGRALVGQLSGEDNNVTVVDMNPDVVKGVSTFYDVMGVTGNGTSYTTLMEADIEHADILIAVTHSDEVNLLCCVVAKRAGNCHTIARVRNPIYSAERGFLRKELGLSMIINPEFAAAMEIARLLRFPSAIEIDSFSRGRIEMLRFKVREDSLLIGYALKDLSQKLSVDVLVCAVERSGNVLIPDGDFVVRGGDVLSVIAIPGNASAFFKKIGIRTNQVKNTLIISCLNLVFGFPAPIIFALLLNEVQNSKFKKIVQTVTYLPHFVSTVVICGLIVSFSAKDGLFNDIIELFGGTRSDLLMSKEAFRPIYIASGIWSGFGWGSIIYLSALSSVDQEQYEAAYIDGAKRFQRMIYITLPGILPTIVIKLIMEVGSLMSVGHEKILLLYSPLTYEVADVISTYVYRKGLVDNDYSYSTAVGLFNSVINIILLVFTNTVSRRLTDTSLW